MLMLQKLALHSMISTSHVTIQDSIFLLIVHLLNLKIVAKIKNILMLEELGLATVKLITLISGLKNRCLTHIILKLTKMMYFSGIKSFNILTGIEYCSICTALMLTEVKGHTHQL